MDDVRGPKLLYRVREFAKLAGVTVRTLHYYDRVELLRPRQRTESGYRLYRLEDLERLEQIVALKYLGLTLEQIRTVLGRSCTGFLEALCVQRRLLENKRLMLDRAIQAIREAETKIRAKETAWPIALKTIIEVIEMEQNSDWTTKYATEEGRVKIDARRPMWSPELQELVSRQWNALVVDVEGSFGEDPVSEKAQALAGRWNALVEEFTGRDRDVEDSVSNIWAHRESWPGDMDLQAPAITPQVWEFIARANQVSGYSAGSKRQSAFPAANTPDRDHGC